MMIIIRIRSRTAHRLSFRIERISLFVRFSHGVPSFEIYSVVVPIYLQNLLLSQLLYEIIELPMRDTNVHADYRGK